MCSSDLAEPVEPICARIAPPAPRRSPCPLAPGDPDRERSSRSRSTPPPRRPSSSRRPGLLLLPLPSIFSLPHDLALCSRSRRRHGNLVAGLLQPDPPEIRRIQGPSSHSGRSLPWPPRRSPSPRRSALATPPWPPAREKHGRRTTASTPYVGHVPDRPSRPASFLGLGQCEQPQIPTFGPAHFFFQICEF